MMREVKRTIYADDDPEKANYKSTWIFYESVMFIKEILSNCIERSVNWRGDERLALINYYRKNPCLWNHKRKDYLYRNKKLVLRTGVVALTDGKYSERDITNQWSNTKTYVDRKNMLETGSKKTGGATDQVYFSQWKFMKEMRFVADLGEPDEAKSTLEIIDTNKSFVNSEKKKRKKRQSKEAEFQEKRFTLYDTLHAKISQPPSTMAQKKVQNLKKICLKNNCRKT